VAGSRPASFLPDSSSAFDKHRRREESPVLFATFTRLSMSAVSYLMTRFAPLPADDEASTLGDVLRAALRIQRNLQRNLYVAPVYVVPVRGESDVLTIPGCAGLTSAAYESESIRHLRTILLRMT